MTECNLDRLRSLLNGLLGTDRRESLVVVTTLGTAELGTESVLSCELALFSKLTILLASSWDYTSKRVSVISLVEDAWSRLVLFSTVLVLTYLLNIFLKTDLNEYIPSLPWNTKNYMTLVKMNKPKTTPIDRLLLFCPITFFRYRNYSVRIASLLLRIFGLLYPESKTEWTFVGMLPSFKN